MSVTRNRRRPGTVTGAAVIAFVLGGLIMLYNLTFLFSQVLHYSGAVAAFGAGQAAIATVFLVTGLVLGALLVWGGVAAIQGRTATILLVVSVLTTILYALGWFIGIRALGITVLDIILVVPLLTLMLQPSSKDFFATAD